MGGRDGKDNRATRFDLPFKHLEGDAQGYARLFEKIFLRLIEQRNPPHDSETPPRYLDGYVDSYADWVCSQGVECVTCVAMRFIGTVIEKLQRHPKRIVFPEGDGAARPAGSSATVRLVEAFRSVPILLGDRTKVKEAAEGLNVSLEGVRIINPVESEDLEGFAKRFESLLCAPKA